MSRYTVRKVEGHWQPWQVRNPDGKLVWASRRWFWAMHIADQFATRHALHEDLKEKGI